MLRLLIVKFGAQLKEIQISPEHGEAYVKELRSYYFIHYGAQGVCEFFLWGGRITVRPVVRIGAYTWRAAARPGRNIGVPGVPGGRNKCVPGLKASPETLLVF